MGETVNFCVDCDYKSYGYCKGKNMVDSAEKWDDLPRTDLFRYFDPGQPEGEQMQFRLIYDGPLHSAGNRSHRTKEKHIIRRQFHK